MATYVWVLPYGFMSVWMASRIQAYWFMTPEAAALDFKTNMIPNGTYVSLLPRAIVHPCSHVRSM